NASERKGRSTRRGRSPRAAAPPPTSKIARKTQAAKNLRFRATRRPESLCKGKVNITSNQQFTKKRDINYATQQIHFCGNRAMHDCLLHDGIGAFRVGSHARTGYHYWGI